MKVLKYAIWSVWLSGVLLMCLSFYMISNISSTFEFSKKSTPGFIDFNLGFEDEIRVAPIIHIFTSPDPFSNDVWFKMALSVSSWIQLSENVSVVLFSRDVYVHTFTDEFGSRVTVDPNVDFSFCGTPFFHSMVARTRAYKSDVAVLIDREAILFPDFISTLSYAHKLDMGWFLFSLPRNVTRFSYQQDEDGHHWLDEDVKEVKMQQMQEYLSQVGHLTNGEERMLMAWNNVDSPLHIGVLPPFLYKKGVHNQWMVNEILLSNVRFIFDATNTISSFFGTEVDSRRKHLVGNSTEWKAENVSWEYDGNRHLAASYGSLFFHKSNFSVIAKLSKCMQLLYFLDPYGNPIYYPVTTKKLWKNRMLHSWRKMIMKSCVLVNDTRQRESYQWTENQIQPLAELSLPFTLEELLSMSADYSKTVVLAVAGSSYKEMLMSWVCRLRQLQISNFLVCALDQETYQFSVLQGLPVYKDSLAPRNISFNDCHFGTECFQRVTKVKSRLVLQILKMGYNVLMSDVDVYWFQDPRPYLYSYNPGVLAAQSDEYNKNGPINMPRRLNSGFYFARSDIPTISALEKVVKHAAKSNLSEQPSFYDTLCGKNGSYRISDNRCLEPKTNLTVHFLDRDLFPNGAYRGFWEKRSVRGTCVKMGCIVLHNNWISGRQKKLERQIRSGLWEYDATTRMCLHDSHKS
ncbi:unnamed protein product [Rhodiola kirilowii]